MVVSAVLLALLTAACGSSSESAPAASSTVAPTSAPAATSIPEPTATPELTPTPEFVPRPREMEFADGQFTLHFLYRDEFDLVAAIDVVDVESALGPALERIGPLIEGEKITATFKTSSNLNPMHLAKLEGRIYVIVFDIVPGRIDFRINPNGSISMEDFWQVIAPFELASQSFWKIRFTEANGTYANSLMDIFVMAGIGVALEQELFPDHEAQLRKLRPEYASVIYDLTSKGEREIWERALPDLDAFGSFST